MMLMKLWNQFLDSLATRGGSIFMLLLCSFLFGAASLKFNGSALDQTFAAFTGALLMALTNAGKASNVTESATVTTSVPKPEQDENSPVAPGNK